MSRFITYLEESTGVTTDEKDRAEKLLKKINPKIKLEYNPSGRKITVIGPDNEAVIQQGAGDGKWRARYGSSVDEVTNFINGLTFVLDWVDSDYDKKKFKAALAVAAAGEEE